MDWVPEFYTRQFELTDDPGGRDVQPEHREIALTVQALATKPARVLELGAGPGQVAAALADLGYDVVAVELVPAIAARARDLAAVPRAGTMTVLQGDFYEIELAGTFDVVCYWDGFGIGSDTDQRLLLQRVREWLAPGGHALIEVYTPWYWAWAAGRIMRMGRAVRQYDFDGRGNRMVDTWWSAEDPTFMVMQSLRCYAPADLALLLEGTGLHVVAVTPGGYYDAESGRYEAHAPLARAMSYVATLAAAS
ncbi:MAG: methyltransferase domain-containing protein [Thermomicrobiales bacterium]